MPLRLPSLNPPYDTNQFQFNELWRRIRAGLDDAVGLSADLALDANGLPAASGASATVFRKNCILNGSMRHARRGTTFAAVAGGVYTLDRWLYGKAGTMVHTVTQDTDVPTVAQAGTLFTNSLRLNLTTADTSIAAGDVCSMEHRIEGYNFQRIAQRAFTVGFWVKATLPGVYSIAVRSGGVDRSYVSNFTINTASTWEFKSVKVSASPSAGTWNYVNGVGLFVNIVLATGATYQTTANAWQVGNFVGTSANINGVNTGATDFRITGVQVEPGSVSTEFEWVDAAAELNVLQRYFWKSFPYATAPAQNVGATGNEIIYQVRIGGISAAITEMRFPVPMRTAPTITFFNPAAANANWRNISLAVDSAAGAQVAYGSNDLAFHPTNAQVVGDLVGNFIVINATADAEL